MDEIKKLQSDIKALEADVRVYSETLQTLNNKLNQSKQRLEYLTREPVVSDHAFIRYLERRLQIDVAAWKRDILTDGIKAAINAGAASVTVDGVEYRVKNKTIVTVLADA